MPYRGPTERQFRRDLAAALKRWRKASLGDTRLAAELPSVQRRVISNPDVLPAAALQQAIRSALERLRATGQGDLATLLEQRYLRGQTVLALCENYHIGQRALYYRLTTATNALAEALWALQYGELQYGERQYSEPQQSQARRTDWSARADGRPAETEGKTGGSLPAPPLAPSPPPPPPGSHLPPPSYSRLFGINWILSLLLERLSDKHDHWLISVEGMGGLGKTALAREAAGRLATTGRFAGIAWVTAKHDFYTARGRVEHHAEHALTFEQLLDSIADQLEDPSAEPLPPSERREAIRVQLRARPYLVVIDNLDVIQDCETLPDQLWELANPTKFLFTSRHKLGPCTTGWVTVSSLSLDYLTETDAAALLRYEALLRGLHKLAQAPPETLRPILAATGGHPLAIKLVAGQLISLPLSRVQVMLEARPSSNDPFYEFLYRPSWDLLAQPARQLLELMAMLPAGGSGWDDLAALAGLSDAELTTAIAELINRSLLLAGGVEDKIYTIHPLTRRYVSALPAQVAAFQDNALHIGRYYLSYVREFVDDFAALGRKLEHILQAIELCAEAGPEGQRIAVDSARLLGRFVRRRGNLSMWLPYLDLALKAADELGDEASQADLWNQQGMLLGSEGDLNEVLTLHQRAAAVFERLGDRLNQARTLRWLGNVYYTRAERAVALAYYEQARDLLAGLDKPDARDLSPVYNNIACVYSENMEWSRAASHYEHAIALLDPERDRGYLTVLLENLGTLHWRMGCWQRAIDELLLALPLQLAVGDRVGEANTHHYLALCYADLGQWDLARTHGRQALSVYTQMNSANSQAHLCTDLAAIYRDMGEYDTAWSYLAVAEPLWRQRGETDGLSRARLVEGDLYCRAGNWARAETSYQNAMFLTEERIDHQPRRVMALLGMAAARMGAGDHAGAREVLSRAEAIAGSLGQPDLQVRILWLQAELNPHDRRKSLEQALALCSSPDGDNDRLDRLARETQARLDEPDGSV